MFGAVHHLVMNFKSDATAQPVGKEKKYIKTKTNKKINKNKEIK